MGRCPLWAGGRILLRPGLAVPPLQRGHPHATLSKCCYAVHSKCPTRSPPGYAVPPLEAVPSIPSIPSRPFRPARSHPLLPSAAPSKHTHSRRSGLTQPLSPLSLAIRTRPLGMTGSLSALCCCSVLSTLIPIPIPLFLFLFLFLFQHLSHCSVLSTPTPPHSCLPPLSVSPCPECRELPSRRCCPAMNPAAYVLRWWAVVIGTAVPLTYVLLGGMRSSLLSDVLQGCPLTWGRLGARP